MARHVGKPDYYKILAIEVTATPDEVKRAYRRLMNLIHPDKNSSPDATREAALLNQAHEILSDLARRSAYDASRRSVGSGSSNGRPSAGTEPSPTTERQRAAQERERWRGQPEPEVARGDRTFVVGHWYLHPEKGTFRVERIDTADRVYIRFCNGDSKLFVGSTLWRTCHGQSPAHREPEPGAKAAREAEERRRHRAATEWKQRQQQEEAERRATERRQEAAARARHDAEERAVRLADQVRKAAEQRAVLDRRRQERQEQGRQHRETLSARRARAADVPAHSESEERAPHRQPTQFMPRTDDPLAWTDSAFVVGHWYSAGDGAFEVVSQKDQIVVIRFPGGDERAYNSVELWSKWQDIKASRSSNLRCPVSSGGDVPAMARQIYEELGLERLVGYLEQTGWVALIDKRPARGPLFMIPRPQHRESVDRLLSELKGAGARLLLARGGGGVTDGTPAWIVRLDVQ